MTDAIQASGMDQADYMKIFMQELTYQDPLKPVDNKEFMAQMAQFSALQQTTEMNHNLVELLKMTSSSQALTLLGHQVSFAEGRKFGKVIEVVFEQDIPKLKVRLSTEEGGTEIISLTMVKTIGA
ncbi:MAG: hypothetical protein JJT82_06040 [Legionellaceae bacterium]|nr:hypothetical protein [Legionellaceae bacterium]